VSPSRGSLLAVQIKICGLTSLDDALAAVDSGADYLGFNFYAKSPRYVDAEACASITAELSRRGAPMKTVGVFVNHSPAAVAALMDQCRLDLAQLHGDEQIEHLPELRGRAFKVLRGATPSEDELQTLARFGPGQPAFLLDAHAPGLFGGTGQLADWDAAAALAARYPIFLAGGLTPDNVAAAIATVSPWGVDVASGVEAAPGKKDAAKMKAFVEIARGGKQGPE
jgi:phosphoribosylanthranilate isomerase